MVKLYNWCLKRLLGVRKLTCNDICYVESGYPTFKDLIRQRQHKFLYSMWHERSGYDDDPLAFTIRITVNSNTSTSRTVREMINTNVPDLSLVMKKLKDDKCLAMVTALSFGTIFSKYLMETRASSTKVSWIYNMFHVSSCLGSVMGATLVEELGWRKVIFASGLLTSLGMVMSAFTTSPDLLFFSYAIVAEWICYTHPSTNGSQHPWEGRGRERNYFVK
ncbi:uncharacterized protein LOC135093363 isoform X9 [Scylla paramamosain]|uniref:uncharacterized protein LOC135093363 isoform X9 n=1 Tax=Scylla paramamosain TaxID=85552 RepID=UPI003082CB18